MAEPVNLFTITSFFSEVPLAVKKGLNSFNSNRVVSVAHHSGGIIKGRVQASMKKKVYEVEIQCCFQSTKPVVAARLPHRIKLSAGKRYAWCACGHSQKQPFCDGAHTTKAPSITPLRFTPDKDKTVMLCACKQTGNAPYCDGTHFKVIFQDLVKSVKTMFK